MTPEREKLIRDTWREFSRSRRPWPEGSPTLTLSPRPTPFLIADASEAVVEPMDRLVFRIEEGTLYGRPALRIACEGVQVSARYLQRKTP